MNRYGGNAPNAVFQRPEIAAGSVSKFDRGSFLLFFAKQPYNLGRSLGALSRDALAGTFCQTFWRTFCESAR